MNEKAQKAPADPSAEPGDVNQLLVEKNRLLATFHLVSEALRENTERLERSVKLQEALLRINSVVQEMIQSADIETVIQVCLEEIQKVGLDVQVMAVHRMIEPEQCEIETYRIGPEGPITIFERRKGITLTRLWEAGQCYHNTDIEKNDPERDVAVLRSKFNGLPIRSLVDVPYSRGMFSAHSIRADVCQRGGQF